MPDQRMLICDACGIQTCKEESQSDNLGTWCNPCVDEYNKETLINEEIAEKAYQEWHKEEGERKLRLVYSSSWTF